MAHQRILTAGVPFPLQSWGALLMYSAHDQTPRYSGGGATLSGKTESWRPPDGHACRYTLSWS